MYSVEQTASAQGLAEGDTITVVCTGDVGKPPAKHVFEKYLDGKIVPLQYTVTSTLITDMSENCTYYRTSNLTFKVTAKDNNAVIRCVVNSSMSEPDMCVDTEPIQVYYYDAQSTTFRNTVGPLSKAENTGKYLSNDPQMKFRSLLMTNPNDRSADYVNTTQQQNPSLYEGVGQDLDVHNYEQLSRMGHLTIIPTTLITKEVK
ncbi:unnamed protein product [Mytilus edulis]|uniref:Uncharacterized protein n=1 Tax=Mytilus edulis TaxID=6550 RepID=A0A8S3PT45_MYTED|nr:unnamed protein product [Mytilus edulis]